MRSIKYCVRKLRKSSPMYCLMNESPMIVAALSAGRVSAATRSESLLYAPFKIFSAACTSRRWYASTRSVIALISGSFLYGFVS